MTTTTTTNREAWLHQVAARMAPRFAELGFPLPAFRAAIGFPYKSEMASGQCWDKRVSGDGHFEIFINPGRDDSRAIASTLAHELIHAAVGLEHGHKGDFATLAKALGFQAPLTHAQDLEKATELAAWIDEVLKDVGTIPHAALQLRSEAGLKLARKVGGGIAPTPAGDGDSDGDDAPVSSLPKTQTTRMRKCVCAECGYTVRTTMKWLLVGVPHCPLHGAMEVEGGMPAADDDSSAGD